MKAAPAGADELEADLAAFGIERGESEEPEEGAPLLIYPDNWQSVQVFWALGNCWRIDSMAGRYLGIDRPAIETTLRLMGVKRKKRGAVFEDLRVMEGAALEVLYR